MRLGWQGDSEQRDDRSTRQKRSTQRRLVRSDGSYAQQWLTSVENSGTDTGTLALRRLYT